jgi:crossover junction endodeoxyribonuclease RuvC
MPRGMALSTVRIIGIDPGLRRTGWGMIVCEGSRLSHIADGVLTSDQTLSLAERLVQLRTQLAQVIAEWRPDEAAVEETFVNSDARATLKLGQARGIALLVPAEAGLPIAEYAPNQVKKTVVGAGHAEKGQIHHMVKILLPRAQPKSADAADALAIAICHAHHRGAQSMAKRLARS